MITATKDAGDLLTEFKLLPADGVARYSAGNAYWLAARSPPNQQKAKSSHRVSAVRVHIHICIPALGKSRQWVSSDTGQKIRA